MICLLPIWDCDDQKTSYMKGFTSQDWHAGWVETSIVMALEPELVRFEQLELDKEPIASQMREHPDNYQHAEKIVDDAAVVPRMTQRPEVIIGVMGYPEKSSAQLGQQMVSSLVANASARIQSIEARADGVYKEVPFTPEPLIF
jgi:creatinine amidohydrolase/Fe(II)-dependent formamide hydrolase-like protein